MLTEVLIFIVVPLLKVKIEILHPMKRRSMSDKPRHCIGSRKNALESFKIFNAKTSKVERVIRELAEAIVRIPVKGVDSEAEVEGGCLPTEQFAVGDGL